MLSCPCFAMGFYSSFHFVNSPTVRLFVVMGGCVTLQNRAAVWWNFAAKGQFPPTKFSKGKSESHAPILHFGIGRELIRLARRASGVESLEWGANPQQRGSIGPPSRRWPSSQHHHRSSRVRIQNTHVVFKVTMLHTQLARERGERGSGGGSCVI